MSGSYGEGAADPNVSRASSTRPPEFRPELARSDDAHPRLLGRGKEIGITGDQHVGARLVRGREDPAIGLVTNANRISLVRPWDDLVRPEIRHQLVGVVRGHVEAARHDPPKLLQDDLSDHEVVLGDDAPE